MALSLSQVYARSAWRARALFSGGSPASVQPTDFAITRADGGPTTVTVTSLILVDGVSLELLFSEQLIAKVLYVATWGATSLQISHVPPAHLDPAIAPPDDDPDAEANGVDWAWISSDPTPAGGMPKRKGTDCVRYDLPNRAVLKPSELVQYPTAGADLNAQVDGAASDVELVQLGGALGQEFRRDPRVNDADIDVVIGSDPGEVDYNGQVQTRAGQTIPVRSS